MEPIKPGLTLLFRSITEDEPDKYENELTKRGLKCHFVPVLTFRFGNLKEIAKRMQRPHTFSGIVFTSTRAVEAIVACLKYIPDWTSNFQKKWNELPIFVVGPATGFIANTKLGLTSVGNEVGNAEELGELIKNEVATLRGKPLFFPSGNMVKETIPAMLTPVGLCLECMLVYATEADLNIKENIESLTQTEGNPEYVVFFSPSGIKFTQPILEELKFPLKQCKCIAIGPSTRDALIKQGLTIAGMAEQPTPIALANAIKSS